MDGWGEDGAHGAVPALHSTTCTIVCYRFRGRIAASRQVCFLIGWISVLTCTNQHMREEKSAHKPKNPKQTLAEHKKQRSFLLQSLNAKQEPKPAAVRLATRATRAGTFTCCLMRPANNTSSCTTPAALELQCLFDCLGQDYKFE